MNRTFSFVIVIIFLAIVLYMFTRVPEIPNGTVITNFTECVADGNPVMESYPRQCRTADGQLFVEEIDNSPVISSEPAPTPVFEPEQPAAQNPCYIGGCSSQICSDQEGAISTCEYREEYACYQTAKCERQPSGECGWTQTSELLACLGS